MWKFRKKPVEVEAVPVRELLSVDQDRRVPSWAIDAINSGTLALRGEKSEVKVITMEGNMVGSVDDWIIRGVKGELYPCKPDIFTATYEPA